VSGTVVSWRRLGVRLGLVFFGIGCADLIGHAYYRVSRSIFLWEAPPRTDFFNAIGFVERVSDERGATLRRNAASHEIDSNRFRSGAGFYDREHRNIVFLGDSVPFGWDVPSKSSVPSHFAGLLDQAGERDLGVINAAVPGYTLH
jgi:hypothetical protein